MLNVPFFFLRKFTGGFQSALLCLVTSTLLLLAGLAGIKTLLPKPPLLAVPLAVYLSLIPIFPLSPIDSINRKLTSKEQRVFRRIAIGYLFAKDNDEFSVVIKEYNKLINSVEQLTESVRQAEKLKNDATYYALLSQIQPHFLFNTLENIRMHIEIEDTDSAKNMLFALCCFLRYNMSMQRESTLLREVEHVRNYLLIYQYRQKNKISFQINLPPEIQDVSCPFCILQPIAENCLRHAQMNGVTLHITVSVRQMDGKTWVEIADDGRGMTEEEFARLNQTLADSRLPQGDPPAQAARQGKTGGIGLVNVNSRLKYFFGPAGGLLFRRNVPRGTICILVLGESLHNLGKDGA